MEKNHDRPIQAKTVSLKNFISFPVIYWFLFFVLVIYISYSEGKKKLANYEFTEGIVVDKVFLPYGRRRARDVEFAQWQYIAGKDTLLFVDRRSFSRNKPVGTRKTVIYLRDDPGKAFIYSFQFWIDFPKVVIMILIAVFIFAICIFAFHWNDKAWFAHNRRYFK